MNANNNSSNYNGEQSLDEADECNSSSEIIVTKKQKSKKESNISEEKKLQIREKNKLAMQKRRASLSEEQKQQLREQEKLKKRQERSSRSIEEREAFNLKQRARRANLSDEDRAIIRKKDSLQHRNKYQEDKAFIQQQHDVVDKNDDDDDDHDDDDHDHDHEDQVVVSDDQKTAIDRENVLLLIREKRNAQNRVYKKARYAQLKEAEEMLRARLNEEMSEGIDIQQLQGLANRRQHILEYARTYRQNHQRHHRRWWVPIQQLWDEDNPCRQVKHFNIYK